MIYEPKTFSEFVGNQRIVNHLSRLIKAAKKSEKPLKNLGFYGYAGIGKTLLAEVVANEYGALYQYFNSGAIRNFSTFCLNLFEVCRDHCQVSIRDSEDKIKKQTKGKPIISLLDEVHSMSMGVQDEFLSLLNDGTATIRQGRKIRTGKVPFEITFILATDRQYKLSEAIRRRVEPIYFEPYSEAELAHIAEQFVKRSGFKINDETSQLIAQRSTSAGRCVSVCRTCIEYVISQDGDGVDKTCADSVFEAMGIDDAGFTENEKRVLRAIHTNGGVAPIKAIAVMSQIPMQEIESRIEPAMLQKDLIRVSSGGRELTPKGLKAIGVDVSGGLLV